MLPECEDLCLAVLELLQQALGVGGVLDLGLGVASVVFGLLAKLFREEFLLHFQFES